VTIAPGSYFRPHGEPSPWIRINAAYAQDRRAQQFFERAGHLAPTTGEIVEPRPVLERASVA